MVLRFQNGGGRLKVYPEATALRLRGTGDVGSKTAADERPGVTAPARPEGGSAPREGATAAARAGSKMAVALSASAALRRWGRLPALCVRRAYRARPMWRQLGGVYIPDPANPRTPARHLQPDFAPKLYGRHGSASGVDPAGLWPSPEQLAHEQAEEAALFPPLRAMQAALQAQRRHEDACLSAREALIAARMAKMPQMIADWRREREERRAKALEEKERRKLLLAQVQERLGYNVSQYSPQFQEMVQEMEKARRKELKLQKKQRRGEAVAKREAEAAAAAAAVVRGQPAKEEEEGEAEEASPREVT
ncbi:large ribosomal subunit protein mL64 [Paroedura picta]|uniref:large ribosomal subunit protein mL64 n=1 Tax=Paroedura picta TaxID=143630 RepID=UPI0040575CA2